VVLMRIFQVLNRSKMQNKSSASFRYGFTLIELVLVLFLISLFFTIAFSRMSATLFSRHFSGILDSIIFQASSESRKSGLPLFLAINLDQQEWALTSADSLPLKKIVEEPSFSSLPSSIQLRSINVDGISFTHGTALITFFPDAGNEYTEFFFSNNSATLTHAILTPAGRLFEEKNSYERE